MIKVIRNEVDGNAWNLCFSFHLFGQEQVIDEDTYLNEMEANTYFEQSAIDIILCNLERYTIDCSESHRADMTDKVDKARERAVSCLQYMINNDLSSAKCCKTILLIENFLFDLLPIEKEANKIGIKQLNTLIKYCKEHGQPDNTH